MAGISSKAAGKLENRHMFNDGTERNSDFDVNLDETDFRSYDPQIGRFFQIDPLADAVDYQSPYVYADNNPTTLNDIYGLASDSTPKGKVRTVPGSTKIRITPVSPARIIPPSSTPSTPPSAPTTTPSPAPTTTPSPTPAPIPWWVSVIKPFSLTVVGVLIPISTGQELTPWEMDKLMWERTHYDPYPGHGNCKNNTNPHIVYTFTFAPMDGRTPVLKYGISDELRYGTERPEGQLFGFQLKYGLTVKLKILTRTSNRAEALLIEKQLVTDHVVKWSTMPREQSRPFPLF